MVTILLTVHLHIPEAESLKDKRRVIKSLIARLRNDFNISIAEVGDNDRIKSAILGAAVVSNSRSFGDQVMAQLVNKMQSEHSFLITDYHTEVC